LISLIKHQKYLWSRAMDMNERREQKYKEVEKTHKYG